MNNFLEGTAPSSRPTTYYAQHWRFEDGLGKTLGGKSVRFFGILFVSTSIESCKKHETTLPLLKRFVQLNHLFDQPIYLSHPFLCLLNTMHDTMLTFLHCFDTTSFVDCTGKKQRNVFGMFSLLYDKRILS